MGTIGFTTKSSSHWYQMVLKKKRDGNDNVTRYKARLVAKGYSQIAGLDFTETFAPVVRIESIRTLLAIAAFYKLYILHADAKTAFLNGNSDLELYVEQPEGFLDRSYPNKVLRLRKSLYGLKQAPRIWYLLLCQHILNLGFKSCESDPSIYTNIEKSIILSVYVDDILIFGLNQCSCETIFQQLSSQFKMQNLEPPTMFLGLKINWNATSISINQTGYIHRMLKRFNMQVAVPAKTSLPHSLPLLKATKLDRRCSQLEYTEITGSLNHLAVYSILALISHLLFQHSPSSIQIQRQHIYKLLVMSFATLSTQQITQSLMAIQILQSMQWLCRCKLGRR